MKLNLDEIEKLEGGANRQLCTICATAQFVCNKILQKPMGEFTKEDDANAN